MDRLDLIKQRHQNAKNRDDDKERRWAAVDAAKDEKERDDE